MLTNGTKVALASWLLLLMHGCSSPENSADAYGVVGATEVIVSAEGNGKILSFTAEEGATYTQGSDFGYIDTFQLHLQVKQVEASMRAALAKRPDIPAQLQVLQDKLAALQTEQSRVSNLVAAHAASAKDLDAINAEIEITKSQLTATKASLNTAQKAIIEEVEVMALQKQQLEDALAKCYIKAPINGTVLQTYIAPHELAYQGKPLYKMANLKNMYIKVYVTQDMLTSIYLENEATVIFDAANGTQKTFTGKVAWISEKAEFTPKMIVTKEERVNLVYAVKVDFTNDGSAKIGMPGEVIF